MAAPEAPLLYQGVSRSSAAFRLLKQMGWQEGEGLGKDKQGITAHVRVAANKDNSGVGIDAQQKAASKWTFNTVTFDSILKNLSVITAETSHEDGFQTFTAIQDAESERPPLPKKATRPQGRYKKRELGKLLKGKSQADLDAILGYGNSDMKDICPVHDASKTISEQSLSSDAGQSSAERFDEAADIYDSFARKDAVVSPTVNIWNGWWGTRYGFVPAGALGQQGYESKSGNEQKNGSAASELIKARAPFCEQDQENLYKLVQNKATKGRHGLGIADRPKKIGGAQWKGQKVTLVTDDDDNDDDDDGKRPGDLDGHEMGAMILETLCQEDELNQNHHCNDDGKRPKKRKKYTKIKWKRLCQQLLQEAPSQTMKIKHLHKQMVDLHCGIANDDCAQPSIFFKENFQKKLAKSSKFSIEGKRVCLVA